MKKLVKSVIAVGILSVSISTSVLAADMNKNMHNNMSMSHEKMGSMHNNMEEMKNKISAIKKERDPIKQQDLMLDYRNSMMGIMKTMHEKMAGMPIDDQIKMAEKHMDLMEDMMPKMSGNKMKKMNSNTKHNH